MASYIFKLQAGKEYKDDKDLGIQGRLVYCNFLKTRSGYNKTSAALFYHSMRGFTNSLTNYYHLKETLGVLKKDGTKFFIPTYDDLHFMQKDFLKHYENDESFKDAFQEFVGGKLGLMLDAKNGSAAASNVDREIDEEEFSE